MNKQDCTSSYEPHDNLAEQAHANEVVLGEYLNCALGAWRLCKLVAHFGHALAAKVAEAPKQPPVEAPLVGVAKELLERGYR